MATLISLQEPADLSERSSRDLPHEDSVPTEIPDNESPTIPGPTEPTSIVNSSLHSWVAQERFPLFVKVTCHSFHVENCLKNLIHCNSKSILMRLTCWERIPNSARIYQKCNFKKMTSLQVLIRNENITHVLF